MEALRSWLIGIAAAAVAAALADSLTPDGAVKKIGKLAGGLVLVIAVVKPLIGLDYGAMAGALAKYQFASEGYSAALEAENERLVKLIIAERAGAYIQDKAAQLGAVCTVEVTCGVNDEGDPYPAQAAVWGELTQEQISILTRTVEADLAIPAQCQTYGRMRE